MGTSKTAHAFSNLVREVRKKHLGKGPDQIVTRFVGAWAVCELKGNLTNVEKFAIRSDEGKRLVRDLRTTFIKEIYHDPELKLAVEEVVGAKLVTLFCDFDLALDTAITVYVFDRPLGLDDSTTL